MLNRFVRSPAALCAAIAMVIVAVPVGADPAPLSKLNWIFDGPVQTAARAGNTLYVGGVFTSVAPGANARGTVYALSPVTGAFASSPLLPRLDGTVTAIVHDGYGGYYLGGEFGTVDGVAQAHLTHVLASGARDTTFAPARVQAVGGMVRAGGTLYLYGVFDAGNGTTTQLARVDAVSGQAVPWPHGTPLSFRPDAIESAGGRVFVGGFDAAGQSLVFGFDAASGAQAWQAGLGSPGGYVSDLAVAGSRLFVAGGFQVSPDIRGLAALDLATGAVDTTWSIPGGAAGALNVVASGATLYVNGTFSALGGQVRPRYAALDAGSAAVLPWTPSRTDLPAAADMVVLSNGHLVAGSSGLGAPGLSLVQIDAAGTVLPWVPAATNERVTALAVDPGGSLVVGGSSLVAAGGVPRNNLAAFDLATGALLPWAPATDGRVHALAVDGNAVYVGGAFSLIDGQTRQQVAAVDGTSGALLPWAPAGIAGLVRKLFVHDGWIYVLGGFTTPSPAGVLRNVMRLHPVTALPDHSWRPQPLLALDGLIDGTTFHLAGTMPGGTGAGVDGVFGFDLLAGSEHMGRAVTTLGRPQALALDGDTLYLTGVFVEVNGVFRNNFAALDRRTGTLLGTQYASGVVGGSGLAVADGRVIHISSGGSGNGGSVTMFTAMRADGSRHPWHPGYAHYLLAGGETRVLVTGDVLVAVGGFGQLAATSLQGLAVFDLDGARGPLKLRSTRRGPETSIAWGAPALTPAGGYVLEGGTVAGPPSFALPVGGVTSVSGVLPAADYFLRVRTVGASGGVDEVSNEVFVRGTCAAAPAPPVALTAAMTGTVLSLAWQAPEALVSTYTLTAGSATGRNDVGTVLLAGTETTIAGAVPAGTYYARVTATNACGTSGPSGEVFVTVGAPEALPAAPINLTSTVAGSTLTLSWTAPAGPVTGYVLEAGSAPGLANIGAATIGAGTSFVLPGVPPGVYYVRVRAVTSAGSGAASSDVLVAIP